MPRIAGPALTKVTLNLYTADIVKMRERYGYGWSEVVRDWVRLHLAMKKELDNED